MAFWSTADVEPKRGFRFIVQIGDDVIWWAKQVNTPSFDVGEVEHAFLGNKYYFPGKVSWTEVSMTLIDPVSPDAVQKTNEYLLGSGYMVPLNEALPEEERRTISKRKATATGLGDILITVLNADGQELEKWTLKNPFIKSVKYGDLSYEDDALRTVELGIRYDWAVCSFGTAHPEGNLEDQFVAGVPSPITPNT